MDAPEENGALRDRVSAVTNELETQDRIYRAIKAALAHGVYRAGMRLEIAGLAKLYDASPTPVREVLARLVGEGLVEHRDEGGYRFCLPDVERLRDLYFWNAQHLLAALHVTQEPIMVRALEPLRAQALATEFVDRIALTARFFQAIGDATGNREFSARIRNANERLQIVRLAEAELFADLDAEVARLFALGRFDVQKSVRRKILAYHRRRIDKAPQIVTAMLLPLG